MVVYLETVHGSRLYGLSNAGSDRDYFVVYDEPRDKKTRHARQRMLPNGLDLTEVGLTTFLQSCDSGVPQYLEAMFSPVANVNPWFQPYRAGYRVNTVNMYQKYVRTATTFAYEAESTLKRRRHALRLLVNLGEGLAHGKFNPRLDGHTATLLTTAASAGEKKFDYTFGYLLDMAARHVVVSET